MEDQYLDLIDEQWHHIAMIYNQFKAKKPIIEYLIESEKLYSYPANDYINTLSERTRGRTRNQYNEACEKKQFILFIRDEKNQKLKSYILDIP